MEICNLGAQYHVQVSFEQPEYTADTNAMRPLRLLEAIRILGKKRTFYQASTSELYELIQVIPERQNHAALSAASYA